MIPLSSRRTFLKGLPVSLAAVAGTSMLWDRLISRAMAQTVTQKRFVIFWVPDGLVPEWFWHAQPGPLTIRSDRAQDSDLSGTTFNNDIPAADRPTFVLQPLAPYASQILLAKGINNAGSNDHGLSVESTLTGEEVTAKNFAGGPSIDAIMAAANKTSRHVVSAFRTGVYVKQTKLSTAGHPYRDTQGGPMIEISSSPTTDARVMLDSVSGRATGGGTGTTTTTSTATADALKAKTRIAALGAVKSRVDAMSCVAGKPAGDRLEAYIADVDRLETLEMQASTGMMTTTKTTTPFSISSILNPSDATMKADETDIKHLPDIAPFLRELVVTALALDYAPAVAMQWGATGINKVSGDTLTDYRYDFLPTFENKGAGEHGLAHPDNNAGFGGTSHTITGASSTRDRVRDRRWLFNQLRLLVDRLASIPDGSGTLLDNTTILYASEYGGPFANSTAGQHSTSNLPYMLLGGANSPFKLGQGLNLSNRSHGDFLYTLAKGFGSNVTAVGKGKTVIDGILKT
ncbi:MAG TPA: DUF1552 domain-containing protein [Polyangia bacterium]|nr:DUF1552 domain-containing protein [Polyangia bacterium]